MKFRAQQFCSGYMYFSFQAKNREEAEKLIAAHNEGAELELHEEGFEADYGSEVRLCE